MLSANRDASWRARIACLANIARDTGSASVAIHCRATRERVKRRAFAAIADEKTRVARLRQRGFFHCGRAVVNARVYEQVRGRSSTIGRPFSDVEKTVSIQCEPYKRPRFRYFAIRAKRRRGFKLACEKKKKKWAIIQIDVRQNSAFQALKIARVGYERVPSP